LVPSYYVSQKVINRFFENFCEAFLLGGKEKC
jgi:hypothetical protein